MNIIANILTEFISRKVIVIQTKGIFNFFGNQFNCN